MKYELNVIYEGKSHPLLEKFRCVLTKYSEGTYTGTYRYLDEQETRRWTPSEEDLNRVYLRKLSKLEQVLK